VDTFHDPSGVHGAAGPDPVVFPPCWSAASSRSRAVVVTVGVLTVAPAAAALLSGDATSREVALTTPANPAISQPEACEAELAAVTVAAGV
jgi:hypothetical protein